MTHHTADEICLFCEVKLLQARPELGEYFHAIKKKYPDIHISWSYRGQADQDAVVAAGKSKAVYPKSKHNKTENEKPMSHAIDIFEINAAHPGGLWSFLFCKQVFEEFLSQFPHVAWGGNFTTQKGDGDHFEVEIDESGNIMLPAPDLEKSC